MRQPGQPEEANLFPVGALSLNEKRSGTKILLRFREAGRIKYRRFSKLAREQVRFLRPVNGFRRQKSW